MKRLFALLAILILATTFITGCPPGQAKKVILHDHKH